VLLKKPDLPYPLYLVRGIQGQVSQLPLAFPREEYGHTAVPASELHPGVPDAISAK
jgi:hypothetical protein